MCVCPAFVPAYEFEAEIEQRRKGEWLDEQHRVLWQKELELKMALKKVKDDEEYNQLSDKLWDVQQAMTDIQQQLDGAAADEF